MRREIAEEAGIECTALSLRGTISWPGFGKHGEDWLGFVFVVTAFTGTPLQRNPEGTLEWVDIDRLHELPMWEGDREFLPLVFDADPRPFHGVMPYRDGRMQSWRYPRQAAATPPRPSPPTPGRLPCIRPSVTGPSPYRCPTAPPARLPVRSSPALR